jgi:hypothetical protein
MFYVNKLAVTDLNQILRKMRISSFSIIQLISSSFVTFEPIFLFRFLPNMT